MGVHYGELAPVAAGAAQKPPAPLFYGATLQKKRLHPIVRNNAEFTTEQMGSIGPCYLRMPHFKMEFTPSVGKELQTEYFVDRKDGYRAVRAVEKLRDQITPHLLLRNAHHRCGRITHEHGLLPRLPSDPLHLEAERGRRPQAAAPDQSRAEALRRASTLGKIFEVPGSYLQAIHCHAAVSADGNQAGPVWQIPQRLLEPERLQS